MLSHFEYEIVKNCPEHRLPSVRLLSQCSYPWRKVAPIGTKLLQITHHRLIEQIWVQNPPNCSLPAVTLAMVILLL